MSSLHCLPLLHCLAFCCDKTSKDIHLWTVEDRLGLAVTAGPKWQATGAAGITQASLRSMLGQVTIPSHTRSHILLVFQSTEKKAAGDRHSMGATYSELWLHHAAGKYRGKWVQMILPKVDISTILKSSNSFCCLVFLQICSL